MVVDKVIQTTNCFCYITSGENAVLSATTENIGAVKSIKINDGGFNYVSGNPPDATFRATLF